MKSMNISITPTMREWISAQIKSGFYANASDYMRDLIRYDQREKESLNLALAEGEESGFSKRKVTDIISSRKEKAEIMRGYKLSILADADLEEIYIYSYKNFGGKKAEKYLRGLEKCFEALVTNPEIGRDISHMRQNYFRYGYISHNIFYRIKKTHIEIIRVLHNRRDPARHLMH